MRPGIYRGLEMPEYLALKAVHSSLLCTVLDRCPAAAYYESPWNQQRAADDTAESDVGTIAHAILLEGSEAVCEEVNPEDHPNERGGGIPSGWTNKSIRARRDEIRAAGKIPVLTDRMTEIRACVASGRRFIDSLRDSEPAIWRLFQDTGGESELTVLWEEGDTLCKIRPDRISGDRRLIVDVKTTIGSSSPNVWGPKMIREGTYRGAAWYRRGIQAGIIGADVKYVYLVGEQQPPYLWSLVGVDPTLFEVGAERMGYALRVWQGCVAMGVFPAYPNRVAYPEIPGWALAEWEAAQAMTLNSDGAMVHR